MMHHLSIHKVIKYWLLVLVVCLIVVFGDCAVLGSCSYPLIFSLLSLPLGGLGTLALTYPSFIIKLGDDDEIIEAREFNRQIHSAYDCLKNGDSIREGEELYEPLLGFIHHYTDYEGEPSTISASGGVAVQSFLMVDGKELKITVASIARRMDTYLDRVEAEKQRKAAKQERYYSLLGFGIYGLAIGCQSMATIISNIDYFPV